MSAITPPSSGGALAAAGSANPAVSAPGSSAGAAAHPDSDLALEKLAAGLAHSLNNSLAPVLLALPLLRGYVRHEEGRRLLAEVETGAQRAQRALRRVLLHAGAVACERQPIAPASLVAEAAQRFRPLLPPSVRLEVSALPLPAEIEGDRALLLEALALLLENAREALPTAGHIFLSGEVIAWPASVPSAVADSSPRRWPDKGVVVRVRDDGIGMVPDILPRIFEPFFTTKSLEPGIGLGLAAMAGIARLHGGLVRAESQPGLGTTMELILPALSPTAGAVGGVGLSAGGGGVPRAQGEWVLVVDDEAPVRATMRAALEAHGYRVLSAPDGVEALVVYARHRESLVAVITDMVMPGMDGPALVRGLRHLDPAVPLIGFSGLGDPKRLREVEQLRLPIFLPKPFSPDKLLAAVHELRASSTGGKRS